MNFFCIADKASSLGFRFAGIETREVSTRGQAQEALKVALATENVGAIIVTGKASDFIREEIEELMYDHNLPLVLEVPSRGQASKKKDLGEFLKRAIGVGM
ncbi:MAG: V-type ATP synthase subunit F [Candidatus Omnitrophica bacterium]|nr:V-type ATP synthase subunit F [Candidatus Omnitrophota bacterium]